MDQINSSLENNRDQLINLINLINKTDTNKKIIFLNSSIESAIESIKGALNFNGSCSDLCKRGSCTDSSRCPCALISTVAKVENLCTSKCGCQLNRCKNRNEAQKSEIKKRISKESLLNENRSNSKLFTLF